MTVEQIFEFRPIEPLANFRVKFCAKFYSIARQKFKKAKFKNLFHSDVPIRTFYALVLKFLENLEKCGLQMIQRKKKIVLLYCYFFYRYETAPFSSKPVLATGHSMSFS